MDAAGERFDELWSSYAGRVFGYARRHTDAESARDVVAETFLVAWRRRDDVPEDALPWLLVVARNHLANARRASVRGRLVEMELVRLVEATSVPADLPVADRDVMVRALAVLSEGEREVLLLTAWDGLDAPAAAQVLGCSVPAFYQRLSRARARLVQAVRVQDGVDVREGEG